MNAPNIAHHNYVALHPSFRNALVIVFFVVLAFFPMMNINSFPIPTLLFFLPLLIFKKKLFVDKKVLAVFLLSSVIASLFSLITQARYGSFDVKDFLYPLISISTLLCFTLFTNCINDRGAKALVATCAKIFLVIQFIFVLLEITNFLGFNESMQSTLMYWQQANAQKDVAYLEITYRPSGTMGSPIILAIVSYLMGRIIQAQTGRKRYHYFAFLIICLSSAVMPALAFILIEIFDLFLLQFKKSPIRAIVFMVIFIALIISAFSISPFLQSRAMSILNADTTHDYSVSYRLSMLSFLGRNLSHLPIGGMSIHAMPAYVDCEYILRILQFGILGFSALILPYIFMFLRSEKFSTNTDILHHALTFILLCMATSTVLTNIFYTPFIALLLSMNYRKEIRR